MTTAQLDPRKASYWEKVLILRETTSMDDIDFIVSTECEDDFRIAVLANPQATSKHVAWAGKHHSLHVRSEVLSHPLVTTTTVLNILTDAHKDAEEALPEAKYVHPMRHHYEWIVRTNTRLILKALKVLEERAEAFVNATSTPKASRSRPGALE